MIDHLGFQVTDYERSRAFYDAVLATLGFPRNVEMQARWDNTWPERRMCAYGPAGRYVFWLIETREAASPMHLAFTAESREAVDAFHRVALEQGARDNGAPGLRPHYHANYYGAFVLDPDGNNVEAVCHRG